ncbi:MAG: NADPH-dependent 7-cyano-7-deazaguanine reductase QueF [Bacteroidales bacterium]|nr:NADPH-dependent 7-cyano-7-deazaguanine reductase QueF [Bacteroidales bacterium]
MTNNSQPIEATLLGKRTEYPQHYSPEILVAVPRQLNRNSLKICEQQLPFSGADAWHAYEISWLNHRGIPVVGVLKLVYDASSPCIVESKSLKLYLNSFNMHRTQVCGDNGVTEIQETVCRDLSQTVGAPVSVHIHSHNAYINAPSPFQGYTVLEELPECQNITTDTYTEDPDVLTASNTLSPASPSTDSVLKYASHLLRSNCKITHQPDWGSVFIHFRPNEDGKAPTPASLLKYIVSLRGENHFHEEICEMIYVRLQRIFNPSELCVSCIYTRRGGIDICPSRASNISLLPSQLLQSEVIIQKLARQ